MENKNITPYKDINEFLEDIVAELQKVLNENLVGVYLFGSLVWGDFEYESSDIDLLVVTKETISAKEFDQLDAMQKELWKKYKHGQEGMIEVLYASLHSLQKFKTEDNKIAAISPGEEFNIKEAGDHYLMNWYIVREKGITLFGPNPKDIITPISKEEFIQAVKNHAIEWRKWIKDAKNSRPFQAYAILTLCRAYYAYRNADQTSKKKAALWAIKELPQWADLITNAIKWRENWRQMDIDHSMTYSETEKFVNFVIDQLER